MNLLTHNPEEQLSANAKTFLLRPKNLYINGQFVDAAERETFNTEDPALGVVIARTPSAGAKDVERAALAAREAFETCWRKLASAQRAKYLFRIADLITENQEELTQLEAYDSGKPVSRARGDIRFAAEVYRYCGAGRPSSADEPSTSRCNRTLINLLP